MRLDEASVELSVFTFKEGVLARLAHDLELRATRLWIDVADDRSTLRGEVDVSSIRCIQAMSNGEPAPGRLSASDLADIDGNLRDKVLHTARHPRVAFESTGIRETEAGYDLSLSVTLHGTTRAVHASAQRLDGGEFSAEVSLHQPDFGIRPFRAAMGTLRVRPEVRVAVRVRLRQP